MDQNMVALIIAGFALIVSLLTFFLFNEEKKKQKSANAPGKTQPLQLQAYERLLILIDRIALPHLISRVSQPHASARDMQLLLTQNIRSEFDYNITQQIYVSPDAWTAVKNLKEQNLLIINQLANVLPPNATGLDLNKLLLEFLMSDKKGTLHEVVSEVLSYEAKKLME